MQEILLNGTPVKIWARYVVPYAMKEIVNLSTLPFISHHLAFMPDVHGGKGMPIGGVLATKGVVIPNAAGAYKDIEEVMANQTDLVRIVTTLSPVAVIKG